MSGQALPVRPRPTPKKAQSVGAGLTDPMMKYPPPQSVHGYHQSECLSYCFALEINFVVKKCFFFQKKEGVWVICTLTFL